jgi:hypothetical protein
MLLEVNVGLMGASAIVASLLNIDLGKTSRQIERNKRAMRLIVLAFAISGLLSTCVLILIIVHSLQGMPVEDLSLYLVTVISLFFFLAGTEFLGLTSWGRFQSNKPSAKHHRK